MIDDELYSFINQVNSFAENPFHNLIQEQK
jgi:hypothetical protein